ncbi:hypothetical protein OIU84_004642 [Salix udensis]|uniref:ADP,ATP carrier protein n=1 Tax=Salix udensis TaxID=889485 RepID=A0AAD6K2P0_9ROSI|nr:hypothetical protein OIU84_004642 [Salix udensis]
MEAVLQTKGLLSLPPTPKARALYPSQGFKQRLFATKPKTFSGFSLSSNEVPKLPILVSKPNSFLPKDRNLHICRAEAAADGQALFGEETDKPKFLGIELVTFKKIIALGLMFFCILFNYTILRDTKDVLVVTAKGSSAEIIPFLKTWVNLPMAIGFMVFSYIHPEAFADRLLNVLGPRFLGPLAIMRIWTFCLFYVMAELWGSVVVSVLFWGFANQITSVDEAKRFYPLFGLGANVALIFSGRTVKYFSNLRTNLGPGVDGWAVSLKGMMSIVVLMGLAICLCYWWVNAYVPLPTRSMKKKEKPKMSTMESLKFLVSSRYIRDLATLVVAYGISINLVEVTWKSKLKAQFPSPNEYSAFMGDFSTATGIATFTMMLLSQFIFEKYGWGAAAKITPTVLLLTGVGFFSLILFGGPLAPNPHTVWDDASSCCCICGCDAKHFQQECEIQFV